MFKKSLLILISFLSTSLLAQSQLEIVTMRWWGQRDQPLAIHKASEGFHDLRIQYPENKEWVVFILRAFFIRGDFHTQDRDEKLRFFKFGFELGDRTLEMNKEYAAKLKKGDDIEEAVKALTIDEVPLMFWTAANLGKFAKTNGILESLKYKNKILALVKRVEELKPDYFFGAVPRYWGSYYAVLPRLVGRDLKKSQNYFEKSLKMAPEYLGTKVLKAETHDVADGDEREFKKTLQSVIDESSYDQHPEIGPENRMEKIKAKKLLEKTSEFF